MDSWEGCRTLGERLRWVRTVRMGLSSTQAASEMLRSLPEGERPENVSQGTVNRYEADRRLPGADYVAALARAGRVNAAWLLLGEGNPLDAPGEPERLLEFVRRLLDPGADRETLAEELRGMGR